MDFVKIIKKRRKSNSSESDWVAYPDFLHASVKDLVTRGGSFYAFWTGDRWSTSFNELIISIDRLTKAAVSELESHNQGQIVVGNYMNEDSSGLVQQFVKYCKTFPSEEPVFNSRVIFSDETVSKEDYATTQLTYTPTEGPTPNFDFLIDTLYEPSEKEKIMWFMGAGLSGKIGSVQKFLYLYGGKGTGKGTVIDIFKLLFAGYYGDIDLGLLTGNDPFATSQVRELPVLIDADSDISKIKHDTNLLKLTAHEPLSVNQKYKEPYEITFTGLLITASNQRYQVGNIDSGINRRAVVAEPSNNHIPLPEYKKAKDKIKFELPGIAFKSIKLFEDRGLGYYEDVVDVGMMEATDLIFSFVRENALFLNKELVSLKVVSELYKNYLEDLGYETRGYKRRIKNELQRYYSEFYEQKKVDGVLVKNVYAGFKYDMVFPEQKGKKHASPGIALESSESPFERLYAGALAQYSNSAGTPQKAWKDVKTTLGDLDTTELHYVRVPDNHIVIDFDLRGPDGNKSLELNEQRAADFPETYAEISKSGSGIHLHYIYDGDPTKLANQIEEHVEIKVFTGLQSLRRKFTKSNGKDVAHISSGLPLKEEAPSMFKDVEDIVWTEKKMRVAIKKNLHKEYHPNTKPSMDFIAKIFKDAEDAGVEYDLGDLRQDILIFAMRSTHNRPYCVKLAGNIKYSTMPDVPDIAEGQSRDQKFYDDKDLIFFDIEVYQNLFLVEFINQTDDKPTVWFNPKPAQIEWLTNQPIVGFNNTRYDNFILYGAMMGENNLQLYKRSVDIINRATKSPSPYSAKGLCYTDIYDFSSNKQSLKKWEVQQGLIHDEFELAWDQPVPEDTWDRVAEYCGHDVLATRATFNGPCHEDYVARKILADLSGLPMWESTNNHSAHFLFGDEKRPQDKFIYTDLSTMFPGYKFDRGISTYRGENPGEGGYVYSNPGVYENVVEIDVESMHPSSLINLNYFGPYTQRYADLKQARIYVKHHDLEKAGTILNGVLKPYLEDDAGALKKLAKALKIVINAVYGMSSAKFDNKFKHPKNIDNIIAKRGALFMIDLKHIMQDAGYTVVHIKTDSIKIANVTQEAIDLVVNTGKKYGYNFDIEHIFDRLALTNKSVLIGHIEDNPKWGSESNTWSAIGAQFAEPYVHKQLFTHEPIEDKDFAQIKETRSTIYLGDKFVGKIAQVYASLSGFNLLRNSAKDPDSRSFVTGTKGYLWQLFSDYAGKDDLDMSYYDGLVMKALDSISKVGDISKLLPEGIPSQYTNYESFSHKSQEKHTL